MCAETGDEKHYEIKIEQLLKKVEASNDPSFIARVNAQSSQYFFRKVIYIIVFYLERIKKETVNEVNHWLFLFLFIYFGGVKINEKILVVGYEQIIAFKCEKNVMKIVRK